MAEQFTTSGRFCPACGAPIPDWRDNEQVRDQPQLEAAVERGEVVIVPTCPNPQCGWFEGLDAALESVR